MFEKSSQIAQECIFFIDDSGVTQEMMYTEFEAILDGVVGLADFANTLAYCVFAVINPGLHVSSLVFFTIDFDEKGEPPIDWNVPFQSLIQKSATVSVGSFNAKVVSRSVCAVEWHKGSLWDPSEEVIGFLEAAIDLNKLCLTRAVAGLSPQLQQGLPNFASQPAMNFAQSTHPHVSQASLPDLVNEVAQQLSHADSELKNSVKTLSADLHEMTGLANQFENRYLKAREQLLQQKIDLTNQIEELQESLHSKIAAAVADSKAKLREKYEKKLKNLEQEYMSKYTTKLSEITTTASEKNQALSDKENTIEKLEHTVKKLSDELAGFRKEKLRLMADGADKFFERLEESGLNFIAFHPGAGHVSISVSLVGEYLANPTAFAAEKVGVPEEAYLYWLHHYESPCCEAPIIGGKTCGQKISRHESPKNFFPGISDRCDKHRTGVSAQGRVFSS